MYYIYLYYCDNDLLYVGKTINSGQRFKSHKSSSFWFKKATHIHIGKCSTESDMNIYELYYINKLTPKFNIASVTNSKPSFILPELDFKIYTIKEFMKQTTVSSQKVLSEKNLLKYKNALINSLDITNISTSILTTTNNKFHWYIDEQTIRCIEIHNLELFQTLLKYIVQNTINLNPIFKGPFFDKYDKNDDIFISVSYSNYNTLTKRQVLFVGGQNFTNHITWNDNHITEYSLNINYIDHIIKNNFEIKNIVNWRY